MDAAGKAWEDIMDFLAELGKSVLTYLALVACGGVGIFCGIKLRKRKNRLKEQENAEKEQTASA